MQNMVALSLLGCLFYFLIRLTPPTYVTVILGGVYGILLWQTTIALFVMLVYLSFTVLYGLYKEVKSREVIAKRVENAAECSIQRVVGQSD